MPKHNEEYKLTSAGRKYVRRRAKAEAGLSGTKTGVGAKLRQKFTGAKYAIKRGGMGTEAGLEKTMVKPKKVGYGYRRIEGKGVKGREESKRVEQFDTKGKSATQYKERIGGAYKSRSKQTPKTKESPEKFYKSTPEAAANREMAEKGMLKGEYKKGSRTMETAEKKVALKERLAKMKSKYGEGKGARKFKRERKREMKKEFQQKGFMRKY